MKQLPLSTLALAMLAAGALQAEPNPEWKFDYTVSGHREARPQVHGDPQELFFQFPKGVHPSRFRVSSCQGQVRAVNPETRGPYFVILNPGKEASVATNKGMIKVTGGDTVCVPVARAASAPPVPAATVNRSAPPVKAPPPAAKKADVSPPAPAPAAVKPAPASVSPPVKAVAPKEDPRPQDFAPVQGTSVPEPAKAVVTPAKTADRDPSEPFKPFEPFESVQDHATPANKKEPEPKQTVADPAPIKPVAVPAEATKAERPEPTQKAILSISPAPAPAAAETGQAKPPAVPYALAVRSGDSLRAALTKALGEWGMNLSWNLGRDRMSARDFSFIGDSPADVIDQALQAFELKGWLTGDNHTLYIVKESD